MALGFGTLTKTPTLLMSKFTGTEEVSTTTTVFAGVSTGKNFAVQVAKAGIAPGGTTRLPVTGETALGASPYMNPKPKPLNSMLSAWWVTRNFTSMAPAAPGASF